MATLPPVQLHTVLEIYGAYEREHEEFDGIAIPMSLAGGECDRALWYALHWASPAEAMTGQKLRRFETGNIEENRLLNDLRRAGFFVQSIDPVTGKQIKVFMIGGHLRGKIDGKVTGLPEAATKDHIIECKSHNDKSFKELTKRCLQEAKPSHYAQCQLYMHAEGLDRALYLAVNKNTDELYAERVPHDAEFCARLLTRIERIVRDTRAPGKIADSAVKYPCMLCQHKAVCHEDAFGRNHCRTCLHGTPIVDHETTDAPWYCAHFGKTLSLQEQKAGCPMHLFLPDFVPGEQIDAGDDFVVYRMRDGSEWRDGVQYDAERDFAGSIDECYRAVRERKAAGGSGWEPK